MVQFPAVWSPNTKPRQILIWTSVMKKCATTASLLVFNILAWGKELPPCWRLPGRDKKFSLFFFYLPLYLGITPGSCSITPLQSGSPQWVACSPVRAVREERQWSTPVGSSESFLWVTVSSAAGTETAAAARPSGHVHMAQDTPDNKTNVFHCITFTLMWSSFYKGSLNVGFSVRNCCQRS